MKRVISNTAPLNTVTVASLVEKPNRIIVAYREESGDFYQLHSISIDNSKYAFMYMGASELWLNGAGTLENQLEYVLKDPTYWQVFVCDDLFELMTLISDVLN